MKHILSIFIMQCLSFVAFAQVWNPDNGDGTYTNPIIHADYSDPDVIRVGDDYYMVASSFTCAPGIPVLHSHDLVNWEIINHVYAKLPSDKYNHPAHGQGSWAPAIRYHNGMYYVYFCTPEEGLFVGYTTDPSMKWELKHIVEVSLWEDPCPFWDDNGEAWLVRSKLCGGPAYLHRMAPDGLSILDNGKIVYWEDEENPVLEGLKMMKRNGWYYILAPAGGVSTGWQTVLRSRHIEGPYEARKVLVEGNGINGPHQGGLVETQTGEWWFIHFQDKNAFGRIVHLQPAEWVDDWPVIGVDATAEGYGFPVKRHRKPDVGKTYPVKTPRTSDDFTDKKLGLQWQWMSGEKPEWYSLEANPGSLRLYPIANPTDGGNLYFAGNLLLQKLPAPRFTATACMDITHLEKGERAGLIMMGNHHTYLSLEKKEKQLVLSLCEGKYDVCGFPTEIKEEAIVKTTKVWLRVNIYPDETCRYSYSTDGKDFNVFESVCDASRGQWIGAKTGIFCINPDVINGTGYVDIDHFHVTLPDKESYR